MFLPNLTLKGKQKMPDIVSLINNINDIYNAGVNLFASIAAGSLSIIGSASIIAKFMPPPEGTSFLSKVHKWINTAACNSGYAKNESILTKEE